MFDQSELDQMRVDQTSHFMDTCVIRRKSAGSADTFGEKKITYTEESTPTPFGLKYLRVSEVNTDKTVVQVDAEGRFSLSTSLGIEDQIKVTKRFGETLTSPVYFQIVGVPRRGPSGLVVSLKKTEF